MNEAQKLALRARLMFEFLRNFKQEASRDLQTDLRKAIFSDGKAVTYGLCEEHLEKIGREYEEAKTLEEKQEVFSSNAHILSSVLHYADRFAEVAGEMGADQFRQYAPDEMFKPEQYDLIISDRKPFGRLVYEWQ